MVKLFKDGDEMAVMTDAVDEGMFLQQISQTIEALIEEDVHNGDWAFQFQYWFPQIVDICCKYRGYKNGVLEQRVLCSSSHNTLPNCNVEAAYENGKATVIR